MCIGNTLLHYQLFYSFSVYPYVYRKQNNILISNDDPILILFRANHYLLKEFNENLLKVFNEHKSLLEFTIS